MKPFHYIMGLWMTAGSAFGVGLETHVEITSENAQNTYQNQPYQGVVLVQVQLDKRSLKIQSGFFYAHDKVITSISNDSQQTPDPCNTLFVTAPFFDKTAHEIPKQYRCVDDIVVDHSLGFRAFRVEGMDGTEARQEHLELDSRTRLTTAYKKNAFELMGFTVDRELMYSSKCKVTQQSYKPDQATLDQRPSLSFAEYSWMRGECVTQSGMNGGPILLKGKVIGIASGITRQAKLKDKHYDELVWVQMASILLLHPELR